MKHKSAEEFLREKYKLVDFHNLTLNGVSWLEIMEAYRFQPSQEAENSNGLQFQNPKLQERFEKVNPETMTKIQGEEVDGLPSEEKRNTEAKQFGTRMVGGKIKWEQKQIGDAEQCFKAGWDSCNSFASTTITALRAEKEELRKQNYDLAGEADLYKNGVKALESEKEELRKETKLLRTTNGIWMKRVEELKAKLKALRKRMNN